VRLRKAWPTLPDSSRRMGVTGRTSPCRRGVRFSRTLLAGRRRVDGEPHDASRHLRFCELLELAFVVSVVHEGAARVEPLEHDGLAEVVGQFRLVPVDRPARSPARACRSRRMEWPLPAVAPRRLVFDEGVSTALAG